MGKKLRKEALIFTGLFVIAAFAVHYQAWIDHPLEHIKRLPESPFGIWHPLLFTLVIYLLLWGMRLIVNVFRKFFAR